MSDFFPTDVTVEILQRLPVKSLIRFTSVCKSWRSIITAPSFISLAKNRPPTHLLLRRYDIDKKAECYSLLLRSTTQKQEEKPAGTPLILPSSSSSEIDFPLKSKWGYFRIVGSCNGLLCLLDDLFVVQARVILWNPIVRNTLVLPEPGINPKKPHHFVLGFGGTSDDTKVVRLVYSKNLEGVGFNVHPQVELYSLKKGGSWRTLEGVTINYQIPEFMWHQVFLNGAVHWLVYECFEEPGHAELTIHGSILTFNVAKEDFGQVFLPSKLSRESVVYKSLCQISGLLGLISYSRVAGQESGDVWIMNEYGLKETWTKLYTINMAGDIKRVVSFLSKTEAFVALEGNELGCYDSESGQVKKLGISGNSRPFYIDDGFVESLVLVKGQGVVEDDAI